MIRLSEKGSALLAILLSFSLVVSPAVAVAAPDLSADGVLRDHLFRTIVQLPKEKRPRTGIVFSAGSLRATAHVGVAYALDNAGFPLDVVAGTSMGAVMGALYAAGRPVRRIWEIASAIKVNTGSNLNTLSLIRLVLADKLLSSVATEKFIRTEIGNLRFQDLPKPFACVAMDLHSGEPVIFSEGDLATAVRASMNLPGIFAPVEYRHRFLVDGGVVDYIPVDAARLLKADWVLASVTETDYTHHRPANVLQALEQVIDIRGSLLSREQRKLADFLIEPPVSDIGLYEAGRTVEAIEKGAIAASKRLKAAQESLIIFSMPWLVKIWLPQEGAR